MAVVQATKKSTAMEKDPNVHGGGGATPLVVLPARQLSFLALLFSFMLISTLVLSGLLLKSSFAKEDDITDIVRSFNAHQDLGRIVFALGHEMVSTVDLLLAEDPQQMQSRGTNKVLSITWQQTDSILDAVTARSLSTWTPGTHVLLETVQEKLAQFREKNLRRELNPVKAIDIFTNICNNIEREFRALSGFPVASGMAPTSHLLPFSSSSYLLFNRGMAKRLAEIALGTYYFRSSGLMNATNYFDLHYSSKELMKAAFKYNPRAQLRYFELQIQDPQVEQALLLVGSDILNGGVNRSSNVYAARYLDGVKQEIATLLLAKDFLNTTISNQLRQIEKDSFKKLNFNLCVSSIALAIVLMSVVMTCCTFTKISSPSDKEDEVKTIPPLPLTSERQVESMMGYVGSVETIFSPTFTANDRINFLPTTLYNKPHCYL